MPVNFTISDDDIAFAEGILLPLGKTFDEERRLFIKNLSTLDLQAVPGSGKTTTLLAKLLILERKLPFKDGSGILVISHTNTAVDEIKNKIEKHCPRLFHYPNYIGTIQSFVDEFLAVPYYVNKTGKKPIRIDNDIYNERADNLVILNAPGFNEQEQKNAKRYLRVNDLHKRVRYSLRGNRFVLTDEFNGKELDFKKPKGNTKPQNYTDWNEAEKKRVKEWIQTFRSNLYKNGYLCYDDAYMLAEGYVMEYPKIKDILQRRFRFVFVDEMQDMDTHQYDLLEKIFYNNNVNLSFFQRIGDKNQAIFNGTVKLENSWNDRNPLLNLNGSHRLTKPIADIVNCFALHRSAGFKVNGLREGDLKPHIIIYEDDTKGLVIKEFAKKIKVYQDKGTIPKGDKHKYKALAWRKEHSDPTKFSLKTFYPEFKAEDHKPKIDYPNLKSYLVFYDKSKSSFEPIRKNILNAFLRILRYEQILDSQQRTFTKRSLLSYLQNFDAEFKTDHYDELKRNLYKWSTAIIKNQIHPSLITIRIYIPTLLKIFEKTISKSAAFVNEDVAVQNNNVEIDSKMTNKFVHDGVEIDITTVHAAKGQTHTATLYLETFYERKYEPERLAHQLKGTDFSGTKPYDKQSTVMGYVGLSRATHLLCIAVHKTRFNANLIDIDRNKWEIIEIQINQND